MADGLDFKCGVCGGTYFLCDNDPPLPEDIISCGTCRRPVGKFSEIARIALAASGKTQLEALKRLRRDVFGK